MKTLIVCVFLSGYLLSADAGIFRYKRSVENNNSSVTIETANPRDNDVRVEFKEGSDGMIESSIHSPASRWLDFPGFRMPNPSDMMEEMMNRMKDLTAQLAPIGSLDSIPEGATNETTTEVFTHNGQQYIKTTTIIRKEGENGGMTLKSVTIKPLTNGTETANPNQYQVSQ